MARKDEEFAKRAFSKFLETRSGTERIIWRDGSEPPDFFLKFGEQEFAVEVTRVVGRIELNGNLVSKRKIGAALVRYVGEIEAEATAKQILDGAYVIWVEPIPDFNEVAQPAREAFLAYIARTRGVTSSPEEIVLTRPGLHWSIQKFHRAKTYLAPVHPEGTGGLLSETLQGFPSLLNEAVEAKFAKLSGLPMPTILLLVDDYHYAGEGLWLTSLSEAFRERFHTIARTFQEYECQILCSQRPEWDSRSQQ